MPRPLQLVNRSLRLKLSLGVSLALLLVLVPYNWFQYRLQRSLALADLTELAVTTGAVVEHSLQGAMLSNNGPAIQATVDSVATAPEVSSIYLLNTNAVVAASPGRLSNGVQLERSSPMCITCHRYPPEARQRSVIATTGDGQPVLRTMTPIANQPACQSCHPADQRLNGVLYVDFSMAGANARVAGGIRSALLASLAVVVISAMALYALLSWLAVTPLERVARAMRRFSRGEREARAGVRSSDELGLLAGVFNEMAVTITAQEANAQQLYSELERRDALHRQLLGRLTAAREEERRYFARELHDQLGQLLTGLSLHLKLASQAMCERPDEAAGHLARANTLIGETIDESHRLIADLRPTVLDDYGLLPALREELRRRLEPLGIATRLEAEGDVATLAPEIATAAFRIAQEAITNVIRHAGARSVCVSLRRGECELHMMVEDDGVGLRRGAAEVAGDGAEASPPSVPQALGILGMQERADALGGRLEVTPREPGGTRVVLWLPIKGGTE